VTITAWEVAGLTREEWVRHALDIRIRIAAGPYLSGWGYHRTAPKVLYDLPDAMRADGIEVEADEALVINCSTQTVSLLTSAFPDAPWSLREYGDMQVFGDRLPDSPDAPVRAAERMGIGRSEAGPVMGEWHLVQGWRTLNPPNGHAFLVLFDDDGLLVLEATSRRGIGPRYRRTTLALLKLEYDAGLFWCVLEGP
jgi:hypothetical protein